MDTELIIVTSALGGAFLLLLLLVVILWTQLCAVKRQLRQTPSIRVQKLRLDDKNHAFQNPTISPDEELSRRGYSMYSPDEDVERGRGAERQTGGQFVEELAKEIDNRQQRQSTAPPFLLQGIQENKRKSRLANPAANLANPAAILANPAANLANPAANQHHTRQSDSNPNFIY